MIDHTDVYRSLTRLYPKAFRRHYGDDLVQNFADLIERDGARRAWVRTTVDLLVTVPRFRLETIMNPRQSTGALYAIIATLAGAGVLSVMVGLVPGVLLVALAAVLAIAERGRLAASTRRTPDSSRRRQLLMGSLVLAAACVVSTSAFVVELGYSEDWNGLKLLVYNAVFFTTALSAIGCLVAGLLTPRSPKVDPMAHQA